MARRVVYRDGAASTGVGRTRAAWLGVLVLACGRPDDGHGGSLPDDGHGSSIAADAGARDADEPAASGPDESCTGDDHTDDAGAPLPSGDGVECPAPRPDAAPGVASGWARDPATGECCPYANRNAAPDGWLGFDLELECRCAGESCPSTLEEAEQSLCAVTSPSTDVQRFVGCGLAAVIDDSGYAWVFEQPSESGGSATAAPRLVGAAKLGGASSFDACSTSSWSAGIDFADCDYGPVIECQLCGDSPVTDLPPCQ